MSCDPNTLSKQATCVVCIPANMVWPVIISLLCQIRDNGGGGGGGSGTVTSFSAGNLSPLFTTSVANLTTTPALSFTLTNQNANLVFAGPASGGAAAPTYRALVTADLGTAMTPQFARLGVGVAASATVCLTVNATALAPPITTSAFLVIHPGGNPADDISIFQCDCTVGDPYFTLGQVAVDNGALIQYKRSANHILMGIQGHGAVLVQIDNTGTVTAPGGYFTTNGNIVTQNGIFQCSGSNGISQTFDIGGGNTQITFVGGIATAIA